MKIFSMNRSITIGFALLAITLLAQKGFSQDPNFYVFLAFGQSNMEGNAKAENIDKTGVNARFQLLPALNWPDGSRKQGVWTTAIPPLCRNTTGLTPCDYFGRTLCDSLPSNIKIGIINVAVAGCGIEMFDKDKYKSYLGLSSTASYQKDDANLYGGSPYGRLVEMGKAAQKDGVIKGILIHQGESTEMSGDVWTTEVKKIYSDFMKDLSLDSNKVPLLAGGLTADSKSNKNSSKPWGLVTPKRIITNCYVVSSIGCEVNMNDGFSGLHFSAAGYRELGRHYADSMLVAFRKLGTGPTGVAQSKTSNFTIVNNIEYNNGMISFEIPKDAYVSLKAYTLGGKEIAELANANYSMGKHTLSFGRNMIQSGAFVLQMKAGSISASRTIVVGTR